jgi:predicted CoA-substrate-specific enzyme activase
MTFAGIDIGSRTIELVVVDKAGQIKARLQADTGFDPITEAKKMVNGVRFDRIMATGYGRNLFEIAFDAPTVTEIKAHAIGARAFFPESRTVLDIGGQDSKAISLFENGKVKKFEMNDRCAAGTGKFLEIMAKTLGYDIEEFGREALRTENNLNISSMCTVFAESEVTSLIAKGNNRREIARGLHASVIRRAAGMINRVSSEGDIVFTGGVAKNPCMAEFLAEKLGRKVLIPENPQFTGAFGAALLASEHEES